MSDLPQIFASASRHCEQINKLQLAVFSESREGIFRDFAVANPAAYESREKLADFLHKLSPQQLHSLAARFNFLPPIQEENADGGSSPVSIAKKRKIDRFTKNTNAPQFPDKLFQKDMLIKVRMPS